MKARTMRVDHALERQVIRTSHGMVSRGEPTHQLDLVAYCDPELARALLDLLRKAGADLHDRGAQIEPDELVLRLSVTRNPL